MNMKKLSILFLSVIILGMYSCTTNEFDENSDLLFSEKIESEYEDSDFIKLLDDNGICSDNIEVQDKIVVIDNDGIYFKKDLVRYMNGRAMVLGNGVSSNNINNIKVYIEPKTRGSNSGFGPVGIQTIIASLDYWKNLPNVDFDYSLVNNHSSADLSIIHPNNPNNPFNFVPAIFGAACFPVSGNIGRLVIIQYTFPKTIKHEIGHAIGLGHSFNNEGPFNGIDCSGQPATFSLQKHVCSLGPNDDPGMMNHGSNSTGNLNDDELCTVESLYPSNGYSITNVGKSICSFYNNKRVLTISFNTLPGSFTISCYDAQNNLVLQFDEPNVRCTICDSKISRSESCAVINSIKSVKVESSNVWGDYYNVEWYNF